MTHILVVEDDEGVQSYITETLERSGYIVQQAQNGEQALAMIETHDFDLVFTDLKMPVMNGMTLLQCLRDRERKVPVIMITAHGTVDSAVDAMKLGVEDYIQKPIASPQQLRDLAKKHVKLSQSFRAMEEKQRAQPYQVLQDTWRTPVMMRTLNMLEKAAKTKATVLLRGESGTGKELAARAIHTLSPRAHKPLVMVNCAMLSGELIDSELFGHEKGAFTGAQSMHRGRIESAQGGTLFLDELGELPMRTQAKLLRVLQEQTFERVGGNESIHVDVRWIAATNKNLHDMLELGSFREDLYHRVAVFPLDIAPLRDRLGDLRTITQIILRQLSEEFEASPWVLSTKAWESLYAHNWPGNIRELSNLLKRAAILAPSATIDLEHLLFDQPNHMAHGALGTPYKTLAQVEHDTIQAALDAHDGNRRLAAQALGIGLRTLYDKLKRYKAEEA